MDIKSAKYATNYEGKNVCIQVLLNNSDMKLIVPIDPVNTDYAEIKRLVDAGELTIEEAE